MGNCWGLFRRNNMRRHIVLILIGLDNAGKTKTVNNLAGERDDKVLPTVGFKAVNLIHKDTPVTIYDLGGGPQFREIWCQYYSEVHGVIFVIDSSDFSRLDECKTVLEEVLSHDKISGKPVLVLANKQDKSGALDDIDVVEKLNIEPLVNKYRCPTLVESYAATHLDSRSKKIKIDPGLRKGYQWLLNYIVRRYGDINLRVQTDIHSELERRKRMLNRASNRASQTFTAVSDDIATQTGFDNPNYGIENNIDKSNNVIEKNLEMSSELILVKPVRKPNSVDSTITIESVEESDNTSCKPKLSPLFGASNTSTSESARIELEPRSEFRKLSPVIRKIDVNNIDFKNRPQSSPTCEKSKTISSKCSQELMEEDRSRTWHPAPRFMDPHLGSREIVIAERDPASRTASSDIAPSSAATLPARPASASRLIRRQLEISGHRRRLSLRYMQRNKTSPERASMMIYEQKVQRHLDKGDCEKTVIQ